MSSCVIDEEMGMLGNILEIFLEELRALVIGS